jgi:inner membrane protein
MWPIRCLRPGLIIGSLVLISKRAVAPHRKRWAGMMLLLSVAYMGYAGINKAVINRRVSLSFQAQHIDPSGYLTTPAPFNCMLWYIVAAADSAYYTGYCSVWDDPGQMIRYERLQANHSLMVKIGDKRVLGHLIILPMGIIRFRKQAATSISMY